MIKVHGLLIATAISLYTTAGWADVSAGITPCASDKSEGDACEAQDISGDNLPGICATGDEGLECAVTKCTTGLSGAGCCVDGHVGECSNSNKCITKTGAAECSASAAGSSSGGCALGAVGTQGPIAIGMLGLGLAALLLQRRKQAGKG